MKDKRACIKEKPVGFLVFELSIYQINMFLGNIFTEYIVIKIEKELTGLKLMRSGILLLNFYCIPKYLRK